MGGWRQATDGDRAHSGRALRNRRYRRIFQESHQTKRLFTPEIKRFLKGWLVRRRKNPYPNRTEKKDLAFKTGLTYIQICNWFANWRRKLKNSSHNTEDSWGHLIKDYNNKAKGNVEQFSISSDDSIWDEAAYSIDSEQNCTTAHDHLTETDHCYYTPNNNNNNNNGKQYCSDEESSVYEKMTRQVKRRTCDSDDDEGGSGGGGERPVLLSKWLESAARYTPRDSYVPWAAYNVTWQSRDRGRRQGGSVRQEKKKAEATPGGGAMQRRHREELDAAEALTFLSAWPASSPIPGH